MAEEVSVYDQALPDTVAALPLTVTVAPDSLLPLMMTEASRSADVMTSSPATVAMVAATGATVSISTDLEVIDLFPALSVDSAVNNLPLPQCRNFRWTHEVIPIRRGVLHNGMTCNRGGSPRLIGAR